MSRRKFGAVRRLPSGRWQARYPGPQATLLPAPRTFATNRHSLDAWILPSSLGQLQLERITPAHVRRWHAHISGQTGATAVRQAYAVLRAVLNTAVADEALHRNPCRIQGAGQAHTPERPLLGLDEVEALVVAMPPELRTLTTLAFWAHTRLGEVLALRRSDVLLDKRQLRIERQVVEVDGVGARITEPKVGSRRTITLPEPAVDALRAHFERLPRGLPSAPLFTRPDGSELRAHHVHDARKRARHGQPVRCPLPRPPACWPHTQRAGRSNPRRGHATSRAQLSSGCPALPACG